MNREKMLERVKKRGNTWDIIIVGGGATGIGCALDAASRGFDVLLLEQSDFGKGTSSRSTKLVHGGVRYLAQGNVALVREALEERGILLENAGHLVEKQQFIIPCYSLWQKIFYGGGLKIYNLLSGKYSFGKSRILSKKETADKLPNIEQENLRGAVSYFDGQFDDARLLIDLAQTAHEQGAVLLNYARVIGFTKNAGGKISGVNFENAESGEVFSQQAKIVINATGAFCDSVRRFSDFSAKEMIKPSQGIHLVFDESFLNSKDAVMIPKTSDGRVLFAIPWRGKTLVGTTDTPIEKAVLEPRAFESEIEFVLETAKKYFAKPPERKDILSIFAGIRPLVKSADAKNTHALSRDHTITIDDSNLLTITGGKWTTYRKMAEDAVNRAIELGNLPKKICKTKNLKIQNFREINIKKLLAENPNFSEKLHEDFSYTKAEIILAVRSEMAQTLEDVLARRLRALFTDARAAIEIASPTAKIMAAENGENEHWIADQVSEFKSIAEKYI